jgi:hypothetical protein
MRTLRATILTSRNEMTKNDFIETVLYIINKILDYSSSLDQITPTLFDRKNIIKKSDDDISTSQSLNEENDATPLEKEDKFSLADYLYYWVEKMEFNDNLLILTMMNIDKILAKELILTDDNVKNVLFTCMAITQKYYEDENFKDKDYSKLVQLNAEELIKMEIEFLSLIDFSLHISEEEFNKYKYKMKDIWKKKLSFLNFT